MKRPIKPICLTKDTQLFLDSMIDAVLVVNKVGNILQTNKAVTDILGYSEKDLIGQFILEPLGAVNDKGQPINKKNAALFKSIIKGKKISNAIRQFSKMNSERIWVSISTTPILNKANKINGGIIVFRDITEQKLKDDYWADFAHVASHNLRTPLGNVLWAVESMISGKVGKMTKEQQGFIEDIYKTLKDMNRLVDDLLGVSRLHNKKMKPKLTKVSVESIVKKVVKNTDYYANAQNVKIKVVGGKSKNHYIKADENHLLTIIQNLVENAIRYSFPKTEIELNISKKDGNIIFSCRNNGIGIPKDKQKFIFSKFFRAKNAVEKIGDGTGLGLYITNEMVKVNKGEIWFISNLNEITIFNVKFKAYK